jgi:hypothetical protein
MKQLRNCSDGCCPFNVAVAATGESQVAFLSHASGKGMREPKFGFDRSDWHQRCMLEVCCV